MQYRFYFALLLLFCALAALFFGAQSPDSLETALETGQLLRLHVVAHSDSAQDQEIKLRVRDAVIETFSEAFSGCRTMQEAKAYAQAHQPEILEAVRRGGWQGQAQILIGPDVFPDRTYNGTLVPAGTYEALKIVLGDGAGRNWWCVLYPPLCFSDGMAPPKLESGFFALLKRWQIWKGEIIG